jgi:putative endonuclease
MHTPCRLDLTRPAAAAVTPAAGRGGLGTFGEQLAERHLAIDHGCEIVARNWRIAQDDLRGELDLIVVDPVDGTVVVCEVKTRRDADRFDGAIAALGARQCARIRRLAVRFLASAELGARRVRFDLVAVDLGRAPVLTHLPDAW